MGDVERRVAVRVPVRGIAICYGEQLPVRGTIENLSRDGALLDVMGLPDGRLLELELALGGSRVRLTARPVRAEPNASRTRLALQFADVAPADRSVIDAAIDGAVAAAARPRVLVIDDDHRRLRALILALEQHGMTPLAPRTPLDAIDMLMNPELAVSTALLAPSFGHSLEALEGLVADSFPWVRAHLIDDDIASTARRAAQIVPATA